VPVAQGYRDRDRLVVGAGLFGLHAAAVLAGRGESVTVVDVDAGPVMRASLVNQARVHNGYHYPRSAYTALRSASYYHRFVADFPEAMNQRFTKVYAISATGSYTDAEHFEAFCRNVGVRAQRVDPSALFQPGSVQEAYETDEYSFDAPTLRAALLDRIDRTPGDVELLLSDEVVEAAADGDSWLVRTRSGAALRAAGVVNATYAGTNGVLATFGFEPLPLKYELCEVALVDSPPHAGVGITVMDGPFFSLMPFGHSGRHSLTAVDYTPRLASTATTPEFPCQAHNPLCTPAALDNCGLCPVRPVSAFPQMMALARRYLAEADQVRLVEGLHSVKAVLRSSEVDDARPTLTRVHSTSPAFVSLFSGKINTIYDLEEVL
jgi:glycine/D-amino acid oxidase-like deaminating enzyme